MKRQLASVAILVVAAGCALPPQGVTADDLAAFDEAVASVGCEMVAESDYLPVELQTGLDRETVKRIAGYRIANKQAVTLENGGFRLVTGTCAPEAA